MDKIKVFLDDERPTPEGWTRAYWPDEVIALIEQGNVDTISLDHDLGNDGKGTGYDVCLWIKEKVIQSGFEGDFVPPVIQIHSANPVGRHRMDSAIRIIYHYFKVFQPEKWDEFQERLREGR